ncbi:hypothetical protein ABPG75_007016 [Micractinium tetrahymenae]
MPGLLQGLEALLTGYLGPGLPTGGWQLLDEAYRFKDLTEEPAELQRVDGRVLESKVVLLAQRLMALEAPLAAALEPTSPGPRPGLPRPAMTDRLGCTPCLWHPARRRTAAGA